MTPRDFSKVDGIPNDRWELAEVIYSARMRAAWGNARSATPPPREGYSHGRQVAEFDLALEAAREVLKQFRVQRGQP